MNNERLHSAARGERVTPDAELCDATCVRLEQAGEEPTDELYTTVVLPWSAAGAISNGGFDYLFEGMFIARDPGYEHTLAAFERIGATACATAFREALGWLGSPPPAESGGRLARLKATPQEERSRVLRAFYAASQELERQLAAYIRAHSAELEARQTWMGQLGDLRIRAPHTLEQVRDDTVLRSFDLYECSADVGWARPLAFGTALLVLALGSTAAGAVYGWHWFVPAVAAAALAWRALQPRWWIFLRCGTEEVRLGGWLEVDEPIFSFTSDVVKLTRLRALEAEDGP